HPRRRLRGAAAARRPSGWPGVAKSLDRSTGCEVLVEECGHVLDLDAAVPNRFGVDHDRRAVEARAEAPRRRDHHATPKLGPSGELILERAEEVAAAARSARRLCRRRTLGLTDEDMVRELAFGRGHRPVSTAEYGRRQDASSITR